MKTKYLTTEKKISKGYSAFSHVFYKGLIVAILGILVLSSCKKKNDEPKVTPTGPKPEWAPNIKPEMQAVIEKLASFGAPPLTTLTAQEARKQPSFADALKAVMQENGISMPHTNVDTTGKNIPVQGGSIHLRVYTPQSGNGPFPVIVYYHGGGWVIANLDTYDASARALADKAGAVLVSVAYRQAPEYKFPTAHNDSYAAYQWVLNNASTINGDPTKVAVVGESAGGNLAAAVSIMARDNGIALPVHEVLVYPIAGIDTTTASYNKYVTSKPLNKPLMEWFFAKYLPDAEAGHNPLINLVGANLAGLPPTTIISAQLDPLQSEGEMLADKLQTAGVTVTQKTFEGVTHEFFGMGAVVPDAEQAENMAADELKKSFNK
ncbi:alpha/beta hydrolase [Rubrolithibacter danxiaensis]|uniref:alpha/beta hydrolase n=1 Tax=Rubrolithibacter danxiaensis TaxID=3390805 RepID=UPI003BF78E5E